MKHAEQLVYSGFIQQMQSLLLVKDPNSEFISADSVLNVFLHFENRKLSKPSAPKTIFSLVVSVYMGSSLACWLKESIA